jgi:hypothetical protein
VNFCKFSMPCISKALRWSSVMLSGRLIKTTLTDFPLVLNHCSICRDMTHRVQLYQNILDQTEPVS